MGPLGFPELVIIFVVALIVFGPRKLPELGKSLGRGLSEFKRASNDLRHTLDDEIRDERRASQPAASQSAAAKPGETASHSILPPATVEPDAAPAVDPPAETVARTDASEADSPETT